MAKKEILGGGTGTVLAAAAAFLLLKDVVEVFQYDYTKATDTELKVLCYSQGNIHACRELDIRGITIDIDDEESKKWKDWSNAELEESCLHGGDVSACAELNKRQKEKKKEKLNIT
tara:strand:+ start:173 stop:520 length:348 start_codon:yes stop_codon:yes gene_type:complete